MALPLFAAQGLMIAFDYIQGVKNAKAQYQYEKEKQVQSINAAGVYASSSYAALQDRSMQISDSLALSTEQARRDARKASATEAVSAGESGVTGITAGDVQQEFSAQLSEFIGIQDANLDHEQTQIARQMEAITINQNNSIYLADPVQMPNALAAAANIFSAYLSTKAAFPEVQGTTTGFTSSGFDYGKVSTYAFGK